jgi:hypothetical protein
MTITDSFKPGKNRGARMPIVAASHTISVKDLSHLQFVRLFTNKLPANILSRMKPIIAMIYSSCLPKKWTGIEDNEATDLSILGTLKKGSKALFISCPKVSDIALLGKLTGIKAVFIYNTPIRSLEVFRDNKLIEWLILLNTELTDNEPLKNCSSLNFLHMEEKSRFFQMEGDWVKKLPKDFNPQNIFNL